MRIVFNVIASVGRHIDVYQPIKIQKSYWPTVFFNVIAALLVHVHVVVLPSQKHYHPVYTTVFFYKKQVGEKDACTVYQSKTKRLNKLCAQRHFYMFLFKKSVFRFQCFINKH